MRFSDEEIRDLFKAWFAISLAFAILLGGRMSIVTAVAISGLTVGLGFLLHELAHKFTAEYYRCRAEFKADNKMLIFAVISAFLGFIFAAPGAVYIRGTITRKENGIISAAGPVTNIILVAAFIGLRPVLPGIASYGAMINAWLALFNMIPFMNLDGAKVIRWSKPAYFTILALAFVGFMLVG